MKHVWSRLGWALAVLVCAMAAPALEPQEQIQFADGLFSRGMWDVALKEYQVYLDQHPDRPNQEAVWYRMGECYRALGKLAEADQQYQRACNSPAGGEYRFRAGLRRAELMEQGGRREESIQWLTSLLAENPPVELAAACRYALGSALEKADRKSEAAEAYDAVLQKCPGTPFVSYAALALAGLSRAQSNGLERAESLFLVAASNAASPRLGAEAWFQLGDVYFRQKQFEKSARAYEKLAALYPGDERVPVSRLPLAWAFYQAGLYADTLKLCAEAAARADAPKADEWLYLKANSERQLMKHEEAVATYGQLLERSPRGELSDSAAYERALTLYKMGRFADAIQQARALTLTPRIEKDAYWLLAESYAAVKDDANAVQYYRLLVDRFPTSDLAGDALYRLANLLQKKGEYVQAAEWFGKLVTDFPRHELAAQALFMDGVCLGKAQKHEQAAAQWARLIADYPQSKFVEEALFQKAMVEVYLRRDTQCLATLSDLLERFPKGRFVAEARFWKGVLFEEAGKTEEAEIEFRRALKAEPSDDLRARVQFRLALALQRRGTTGESADLLQGLIPAAARVPFTPELLEWLADYRIEHREFARAAEAAETLTARATNDVWQQIGWCLKGKALQGLGQVEPARQAFERVAGLEPKSQASAEANLRLGDIALAGGDAAKAKACYDRAAGLAVTDALLPIRAQAYAGLARALKAQGDLAGAARHFMSVAVLFDDPVLAPECLYEAAAALRQSGKADESAKVAKELQERYPDSEWTRKAFPVSPAPAP